MTFAFTLALLVAAPAGGSHGKGEGDAIADRGLDFT
jgi:hypothetical protein